MLDNILLQVNRPGRYIGQEWNSSRKDFNKAAIKFALCFPDLYEIGMSNLGLRIIYAILNNLEDVCCERCFSVDADMEAVLRNNRLEIFSLESKKRLKEFDMVGFSLGYELGYTNVLNMLELGGLPLKGSLRDHNYPLVIGGGPCVLNPEPMHEFFDLFVIGEAEEAILEIIDIYRKHKDKFKGAKLSKEDLLLAFSQVEGVYVPSLYEVNYSGEVKLTEFKPRISGVPLKIKKRFVKDLNAVFSPVNWLVPYLPIVHDRIILEIMRGCPNSCHFCQARSQYFPFRQRQPEQVLSLAAALYNSTGYEELSLAGLSVGDYSNIEKLLVCLIDMFKKKAVSVSLPSLKPKTMVGNLSSLIATIKKTGLTFAPEAGSLRLRKILGKNFDSQGFFTAIEQAYISGYQRIKLYFMIGLPSEEKEDLDAIIEFCHSASLLRKKAHKNAALINISVNTLIPKPHTPFQWFAMQGLEGIKDKQDYLRNRMNNKKFKLSFHNRYMSILEGILSRGDRRLSEVIYRAFKQGAKFDAWADHFRFEKWQEAFYECKIDPAFYLQKKPLDVALPWDFLDTGISKEDLGRDYNKVIAIQ